MMDNFANLDGVKSWRLNNVRLQAFFNFSILGGFAKMFEINGGYILFCIFFNKYSPFSIWHKNWHPFWMVQPDPKLCVNLHLSKPHYVNHVLYVRPLFKNYLFSTSRLGIYTYLIPSFVKKSSWNSFNQTQNLLAYTF